MITARLLAFLFVSGLMMIFIGMLTQSMVAYSKRVKQLKTNGDKKDRALPLHVVLIALAFLFAKLLNFATIAYDTWDPIGQFPYWVRIPWDTVVTILGIWSLHHLLTYERKTASKDARRMAKRLLSGFRHPEYHDEADTTFPES